MEAENTRMSKFLGGYSDTTPPGVFVDGYFVITPEIAEMVPDYCNSKGIHPKNVPPGCTVIYNGDHMIVFPEGTQIPFNLMGRIPDQGELVFAIGDSPREEDFTDSYMDYVDDIDAQIEGEPLKAVA